MIYMRCSFVRLGAHCMYCMHRCQIWWFIVILTILSYKNAILTIWRFMQLFWRFLEIKNFHYNLYFSTIKLTLNLYTKVICKYLWWLSCILFFSILINPKSYNVCTNVVLYTNYPNKERILSARNCAIHWPIDHIGMYSPRKSSVT